LRRKRQRVGVLEHVHRAGIAIQLGGAGESHAGAREITLHLLAG
jgi:hypothetical protein